MTGKKWGITATAVFIFLALVGVGFAAMSTNPPFEVPEWVPILFFALAGLVALGLIIWLAFPLMKRIRFQKPIKLQSNSAPIVSVPSEPIDFYINRAALNKARGSLSDNLSKCQRVWAIFHTGTLCTLSGELAKCHFGRLILIDPEDNYMMKILEPQSEDILQYQKQIRKTAEMASKAGANVRFYAGPIGNSLIISDKIKLADDKFSDQACVQVETAIPFLSPDDRTSFVIENGGNGIKAFSAYLEHFNTMWARSRPVNEAQEKRQLKLDLGKLLLNGKEILMDLENMDARLDSMGVVSAELRFEIWYKDVSKTLQSTEFNQLWDESKVGQNYHIKALKSDFIKDCMNGLERLEYIKKLIFDKEGSQTQ